MFKGSLPTISVIFYEKIKNTFISFLICRILINDIVWLVFVIVHERRL